MLGIKPHILRYWEQETNLLSHRKNITGKKQYSDSDVQLLFRLKHLIYERKYTLKGAEERIWEEMTSSNPNLKSILAEIRKRLLDLIKINNNIGRSITMSYLENDLREKFRNQKYLFAHCEYRTEDQKQILLDDLNEVDIKKLQYFIKILNNEKENEKHFEPVSFVSYEESKEDKKAKDYGKKMIKEGKTAFLTVAGGQGSRLGFDGPKGKYPITPIRKASLFQIFAEKLKFLEGLYHVGLPWFIMTSPMNQRETEAFFIEKNYFNLDKDNIYFFSQNTLNTIDAEGNLLLNEDGGLFKNPDGHGGLVGAMHKNNVFNIIEERDIKELIYFQIDNPLINVPDPLFLGKHCLTESQVSTKVIKKAFPEEKLGSIGLINGKPGIIEYSDLDEQNMYAKSDTGELLFSHGSIAAHVFNVDFLKQKNLSLPYHIARKKVKAFIPSKGETEIKDVEGIKFEMFIFDIIPIAERALFFEALRQEEFAPLKNKTGVDSIDSCIQGQIEKSAQYLESCGVNVPRDNNNRSIYKIEITPHFALDLEALRNKIKAEEITIHEDTLLE